MSTKTTATESITDDLPRETVKLGTVKPGQIFDFRGETLTLVKLGSDSFRAADSMGVVKSYKASRAANRNVERPVLRASFDKGTIDQMIADDKAEKTGAEIADAVSDFLATQPETPKPAPIVTRKGRKIERKSGDPRTDRTAAAPKPSNLPAKGDKISTPDGITYEVRWVHGRDVLAKLTKPSGDASKWLVQCEHGTQHAAASTTEGDKLGRNRAQWCDECKAAAK